MHSTLSCSSRQTSLPDAVHHPMNPRGGAQLLGLAHLDAAQARLVADHHALLAGPLAVGQPAAIDEVLQEDVPVVDRGDDDMADLQDAAALLLAELGAGGGRQPPALQFLQQFHVRPARLLGLSQRLGRLGVRVLHAENLIDRILAAAE